MLTSKSGFVFVSVFVSVLVVEDGDEVASKSFMVQRLREQVHPTENLISYLNLI